jgi:uncharacterized membrane protein YheB (UPF0754 family)
MAHSPKSSESWSKLLVGALVGALLTGSAQYILNEHQFAQRIESERQDIVRKYLEAELQYRHEKYQEIRRKVSLALSTEEPQAIESAKQALESDLPFFEARFETQMPISATAKELLTYYFQSKPTSSANEARLLLNQLERDFQNDLNRIQGELFSLSNEKSGQRPQVGLGHNGKAQQGAPVDATEPRR